MAKLLVVIEFVSTTGDTIEEDTIDVEMFIVQIDIASNAVRVTFAVFGMDVAQ